MYRQLSPACQKILVSTTYDDSSLEIARSFIENPIEILLSSPVELPLDNITQMYVRCDSPEDKHQVIHNIDRLLRSMNANQKRPVAQAFIFCNVMGKCEMCLSEMEIEFIQSFADK